MDANLIAKVKANLFPAAHAGIADWDTFPWHPSREHPDAWVPHSSQALAIDVFGTLRAAPQAQRDAVLDRLAAFLGVQSGGPWNVELEWRDPLNRLHERRRTQVDAIARSPHEVIAFEVRFTEGPGAGCSQTSPLARGPHRGMVQCNGNYEPQTNPTSGVRARCALTAKGIHYWEAIPRVFSYSARAVYRPCPFAADEFQWMRNHALAWRVARDEGLHPTAAVVYAESTYLRFPMLLAGNVWGDFLQAVRSEAIASRVLSVQTLTRLAVAATRGAPGADTWMGLQRWVEDKVSRVEQNQSRPAQEAALEE